MNDNNTKMKTQLLTSILSICILSSLQAQTDIADARTMALGTTVTITGIVTNGPELDIIRYMQDASAGIAVYDNALSGVNRGDSITITGELTDYNELLEIGNVSSHTVISTGNALPANQIITPFQMSESHESELVQIDNAVFDNGGATFSGNTNYSFTSGSESGMVRITNGIDLVGELIPVSTVSIIALQSQYSTTYQLIPRDVNDIILSSNLFLTSSLDVSNITTTSVELSWSTNTASNTNIKYGLTNNFELGEVNDASSVIGHAITLPGLTVATFYYVQAYSVSGIDTAFSATKMISTESNSTGEVMVFFNNSVDNSVATVSPAIGNALLQDTIISMIQKAQSTIDVCVYNNGNVNIVNALNTAYNNGVVVRYVSTLSTSNTALSSLDPGIDVMKGNADGLMHNKFMVIDRNDVNNSWVLTGSTNWTTNNLLYDYNNLVLIQDQAIAQAYTLEFEEMWGGTGPQSNFLQAKFGSQKSDNTPHNFKVGGNNMEVFFSPSDQPTASIVNLIGTTDETLEFAVLSFTKNEIGTAVASAYNSIGAGVRGVMESIGDMGEEYTYLTGVGVDLLSHQGVTYDIHHKYAVIDANTPLSDPLVFTGSHNWSASAENKNDENTVVIHDAEIANHFHQEFNQRHCELNPSCAVGMREKYKEIGLSVYPMPSSGDFIVSLVSETPEEIKIKLVSIEGKTVYQYQTSLTAGQNVIPVSNINASPGYYLLDINSGTGHLVQPLIIK